jgi:hypothetical protein
MNPKFFCIRVLGDSFHSIGKEVNYFQTLVRFISKKLQINFVIFVINLLQVMIV